jgi:predicted acylesterase/phospholipase RssA
MTRRLPVWWNGEPPRQWLAGVFEGGGLKGVAYGGALQGVVDESAWFGAVAGASAGAITAALVAAGASPDDIAQLTGELAEVFTRHIRDGDAVPGTVRTSRCRSDSTRAMLWHGRARLRDPKISALGTGNDLVKWLDAMLRRLLATRWSGGDPLSDTADITFATMHDRTGNELVIVGVDSVSSRHCIFSYSTTPNCSVADAAIASSSIPFVLRPRRLDAAADEGQVTRYVYPIVDGGVWTNFPKFVFDDGHFRRYHGLEPQPDLTVVGFLLDEGAAGDHRMTITRHAHFVDDDQLEPKHVPRVLPAEVLLSWDRAKVDAFVGAAQSGKDRVRRQFRDTSLGEALQTPHTIPGFRITSRRRAAETGNAALALEYLELLGSYFWYTVLAWIAIAGGLLYGTWTVFERFVAPRTGWREAGLVLLVYVVLLLGVALLAFTLPLLAGNSLGYLAMRKSAAPLATTYVRGSGAPYWLLEPSPFVDDQACGPPKNIVRLEILPAIKTLRIVTTAGRSAAQLIDEQTISSRHATSVALRDLFVVPAESRPGVAR